MTADVLTRLLAERVLGWTVAPDRYLLGDRRWLPEWRFRPLVDLADAFRLLDHAADRYRLIRNRSRFSVEVHIGSSRGKAVGEHKARTITIAVGRALGLEIDE